MITKQMMKQPIRQAYNADVDARRYGESNQTGG
jgi:hypothetical protein